MSSLIPSWPWLVTGALTGFIAYCNLPSALILPAKAATEDWLAAAPLTKIPPVEKDKQFLAQKLWKDTGKGLTFCLKVVIPLKVTFPRCRGYGCSPSRMISVQG